MGQDAVLMPFFSFLSIDVFLYTKRPLLAQSGLFSFALPRASELSFDTMRLIIVMTLSRQPHCLKQNVFYLFLSLIITNTRKQLVKRVK